MTEQSVCPIGSLLIFNSYNIKFLNHRTCEQKGRKFLIKSNAGTVRNEGRSPGFPEYRFFAVSNTYIIFNPIRNLILFRWKSS
jgi:hypothetical protein